MHLQSRPGTSGHCLVNPSLVHGWFVAAVRRLAGQAVPVRISVWADIKLVATTPPATRRKVILLYPERKPRRGLLVGVGKNPDVRSEITVQKLLRVFNLESF